MSRSTISSAVAGPWLLLASLEAPTRAEIVLDWPIACSVGTTCEIQR